MTINKKGGKHKHLKRTRNNAGEDRKNPKNKINCTQSFATPAITFADGMIIRGKYIFPKISICCLKVLDVCKRQSEK